MVFYSSNAIHAVRRSLGSRSLESEKTELYESIYTITARGRLIETARSYSLVKAIIIYQLYEMRHHLLPNKDILEPGFRKAIEKTSSITGSTLDEAFNTYVKYVLYKGIKIEQTRFVSNISVNLQLRNRKIILSAQLPDQVTQ